MQNLTESEIAVLRSLANNHYGDKGDGVWSWAVNHSDTPSGITGKALSGVMGSLAKKGLITSEEYERNEDVIWMTDEGKATVESLGLCESA
jgi:DNA-binding MarR family transcriptional regulator